MTNRLKTPIIYHILVAFVIATVYLCQFVQNEQFFASAQEQYFEVDGAAALATESNSNYVVQLNAFTILDHLKIGAMAYLNPYGRSAQPLVYVYDFTDENVTEAFNRINNRLSDDLRSEWFIGPTMEQPTSGISWAPFVSSDFDIEMFRTNQRRSIASNVPILGQEKEGAYWIPNSEYRQLIESQY